MKLLIDDARADVIRKICRSYPIDGVTTNPTILAKCGRPPFEALREIRALLPADAELHVQVTARAAEGMLEDARHIARILGAETYIKVPAVSEGFRAMKQMVQEGFRVTATAIYTPMQAFLAAKCGASYAAPYVNRIDNMGFDGIRVAGEIHEIFRNNGLNTQVLAASFKNSQQVLALCRMGVGACTVSPELIETFAASPAIDAAVDAFLKDFEGLVGPGRTMKDC